MQGTYSTEMCTYFIQKAHKNVHSSSSIHYYLKLEIIQISNETVACVNSDILTQWNTVLQ